MTTKDFAAYVGCGIFVGVFAALFLLVPIHIFGLASVIAFIITICVMWFSVWGFITTCDKHGKKTRYLPHVF